MFFKKVSRNSSILKICLPVLIVLYMSTIVSSFNIRKCCMIDESILESNYSCGSINQSNIDNSRKDDPKWPWWLPGTDLLRRLDNSSTPYPEDSKMNILTGSRENCDISDRIPIISGIDPFEIYDDGSLLLYNNYSGLKEDTIFPPLSYCVDRLYVETSNENESILEPEFILYLCPCETVKCFLKCCGPKMSIKIPAGEDSIKDNSCQKNDDIDWKPPEGSNHFVLYGYPDCDVGEDLYIPNVGVKSSHIINSDGTASIAGHTVSEMRFCSEQIIHEGRQTSFDHVIRCYPRSNRTSVFKVRRIFYGSLSAVGAVFLALTLIVYALIPGERTVNDKNLICQTWSLLVGYISLAVSAFALFQLSHSACVVLGFVTLYSFLASFFWLNVLCIDLAWAFSELRLIRDMMAWQNRKRFMQYSLYSWLSPAVIVLAVIIVDYVPGIPDTILRPDFSAKCWFPNDSMAKLAYFYGPIAVLLASNILLFLYTAYKIMAVQSSTSLINSNKKNEKQRFVLYIKLFTFMGLSWVLEIVSWAVGGEDYYWYGTDLINLLRAVFIFITLCCKRKVIQDLKERFKIMPPRKGRTTASTSVVSLPENTADIERRQSNRQTSAF